MSTMTSLETLRDIVSKGIAVDVYSAEEALFLDEFIGKNAEVINHASFGRFFGSQQNLLGRELILSVNRVFECGSTRYLIRSIPSALQMLSDNSGSIQIQNRKALIDYLADKGVAPLRELEVLSDKQLTNAFVGYFDSIVPRIGDGHVLSPAIAKLKTARDKRLAHHESVDEEITAATYAEIQQLIEIAKEFLSIMGSAYLSTVYQFDDGTFTLTSDAEKSTRCLGRLLEQAGITVTK